MWGRLPGSFWGFMFWEAKFTSSCELPRQGRRLKSSVCWGLWNRVPGCRDTGIYSNGSEMPSPSQALWEGAVLESDLRTFRMPGKYARTKAQPIPSSKSTVWLQTGRGLIQLLYLVTGTLSSSSMQCFPKYSCRGFNLHFYFLCE